MRRYCNKQQHYYLVQLLLLLLSTSTTVVVNSQSIQGYIYWDINANGILDGLNNNDSGGAGSDTKSELENGIIDVTVQVHSCYSTTNDGDDDNCKF